jgi:putative restriction endonuclease
MTINTYINQFKKLKLNKHNGRVRPHKICMLLAVLDLAKSGGLERNKIYLNPELIERYKAFFNASSASGELANPHYPFFYLRGNLSDGSKSFWNVVPLQGRDEFLEKLQVRKLSDVTENIEFASLDSALFELIQNLNNISIFEDALSRFWFDRGHTDLQAIIKASSAISSYERQIRRGLIVEKSLTEVDSIRSPAFRRVVTQIYDYRCAASGARILLPSGEAMVEAAHLNPFSESGDDDPRNGLALTPNLHWAMDKHLIAPGPDLRWHVSKVLDRRISEFQIFTKYDGEPLLKPVESRFIPKEESLHWRLERLRR